LIPKLLELINKVKEEETRYAKAYGAQTFEFDQFKELVSETKKKKSLYQTQLEELDKKNTLAETDCDIDEICQEATRGLQSADQNNKIQLVRELVEKVTIKKSGEVEVIGHISQPTQNMGYHHGNRHRRPPKRRQINTIQRPPQKAGGARCELPLCNHRAKHRHRRRSR
jgi:hypothetical protein